MDWMDFLIMTAAVVVGVVIWNTLNKYVPVH